MKWSLLELRKYQDQPLKFSQTLDLKQGLMSRDSSILDLASVSVAGFITVSKEEYIVHYDLDTMITVPSTRSLTPVKVPLDFSVDEIFMTPEQYQNRIDGYPDEDILILEEDTIDLQASVEDNIILAIPTQVLTDEEQQSNVLPKGVGWEVIAEDDYHQMEPDEQLIDPRLAKLSELFTDSKDEPSDDR